MLLIVAHTLLLRVSLHICVRYTRKLDTSNILTVFKYMCQTILGFLPLCCIVFYRTFEYENWKTHRSYKENIFIEITTRKEKAQWESPMSLRNKLKKIWGKYTEKKISLFSEFSEIRWKNRPMTRGFSCIFSSFISTHTQKMTNIDYNL